MSAVAAGVGSVAGGVDLGSLENTQPRSAPAATGPGSTIPAAGVFVFRDREELYGRINRRVESMFKYGVIEEMRAVGVTSSTASQMIGFREIRELLAGKISLPQCIAEIQQATRRYAKRQLTWFRRQTNFLPLNLSLLTHNEAVKRICSERFRRLPQGMIETRPQDSAAGGADPGGSERCYISSAAVTARGYDVSAASQQGHPRR